MSEAWHQAHLSALAQTKHFPKSPEAYWKPATEGGDPVESMLAGAKARKAAQDMSARLKKLGKERVIRREE